MRFTIDGNTFDHCYHSCPWFDLDGGPGPVMVCTHPDAPILYGNPPAYKGFGVITHPECDTGFPQLCPLRKLLPVDAV